MRELLADFTIKFRLLQKFQSSQNNWDFRWNKVIKGAVKNKNFLQPLLSQL